MDFYIARQPIFRANGKLFAYELLYRGYDETALYQVQGSRATASLLSSVFITEGIGAISGNKPCFINFTEDLLLGNIALSFSRDQVIIEVLEDVHPTQKVQEALRTLRSAGYTIALDDFIFQKKLEPLVELADIIKIDVRLTPLDCIVKTLNRLKGYSVKLLAEKVESRDEYEKALKLGFEYFQGYFFSKPEKMLVKEIAANKVILLTLMAEVSRKTVSLERLHTIVSKDLSMSYKLLRFLNSAYFYRIEKVTSVKNAMAYLGEKELRRFLLLVIVAKLADNKPLELVRFSLIRAKFCELLARHSLLAEYDLEVFMVGMFSLIDAILDVTMQTVMEKLPVSEYVKDALVKKRGMFAPFLEAVIAYERKQDMRFSEILLDLNVESRLVPQMYLDAIAYANGVL